MGKERIFLSHFQGKTRYWQGNELGFFLWYDMEKNMNTRMMIDSFLFL